MLHNDGWMRTYVDRTRDVLDEEDGLHSKTTKRLFDAYLFTWFSCPSKGNLPSDIIFLRHCFLLAFQVTLLDCQMEAHSVFSVLSRQSSGICILPMFPRVLFLPDLRIGI